MSHEDILDRMQVLKATSVFVPRDTSFGRLGLGVAALCKRAVGLRVAVARESHGIGGADAHGGRLHPLGPRRRPRTCNPCGPRGHLSAVGRACGVCRAHGPDPFGATHAGHSVLHLAQRSDRHAVARRNPRGCRPRRARASAAGRPRHPLFAGPHAGGTGSASEHRGSSVQPVRGAQAQIHRLPD